MADQPGFYGSSEQAGDAIARLRHDLGTASRAGVRGAGDVYVGLAALHEHDPAFLAERFLNGVEALFLRLRSAWSEAHVTDDPRVSAPLRRRWQDLMPPASSGLPCIFESVDAPRLGLAEVLSAPNVATITVAVRARAPAGRDFETYRQQWQFSREHPASVEGREARHCPECGAPLRLDRTAACQYCRAALAGWSFDWDLVDVDDLTSDRTRRSR
jgi:hypothetical protein